MNGPRSFHGISVDEPFRWLEDGNDARAREWAHDQHRRAGEFLEGCAELPRCLEFIDANLPSLAPIWWCDRGTNRFRLVRHATAPQPELCVIDASGNERVILDPNSRNKTLNVDDLSVSPSGKYLACTLSAPGEVPAMMHVFETSTGNELDCSTGITVVPVFEWLPDESGFFYSLFRRLFANDGSGDPRPDGLYLHRIGTDWRHDRCIQLCDEVSVQMLFAVMPGLPDHALVGIHHFSSHRDGFSLRRLDALESPGITLFTEGQQYNEYLGCARGELYFHTCDDAPMGRIVAIDPRRPDRAHWRSVVAESDLALARPERFAGPARCSVGADGVLVTLVEHAHHVMRFYGYDGSLRQHIELPLMGTIDSIRAVASGFKIFAQSFLIPRVEYRYDSHARRLAEISRVTLPRFDPGGYDLRQVFYQSSDGVRVPLYLLHRQDLPRHGNHPTLLYGYGGFGQAITPEYMPEAALWLELGGVFALANIRGGGEYGEAWHAAGSGLNKQASFDDFYAAAQYLISKGFTGAGKLAARGISNGGLLTAVAANQKPDLFAAVVSEIPLTDLLWLDETTAGRSIGAEYGNPFEGREVFELLRSYSPAHNTRGDGPAQLVVVADHDFSAPPGQAYKFVAMRQRDLARAGRETPMFLRLVTGEGHSGWQRESTQRALSEEIAFLWRILHAPARAPDLRDIKAVMRDGVQLAANVWLPARKARSPVVLLRTPYGNDESEFARFGLADYLAAGFAVVFQTVRGRGKSQGQFRFFSLRG